MENNTESPNIAKFNSYKYYLQHQGLNSSEEKVRYTPKGLQLLARYYQKKYQTDINFLKYDMLTFYQFSDECIDEELRKKTGDFRHCFIIDDDTHAVPILYIKENDKEAMLVANSVGHKNSD